VILVTVGAQMPFDRLIRSVESWAVSRGRRDLRFQVGMGGHRPEGFPSSELLRPDEFESLMRECRALVGHAGTGTILSALEIGKPILVMPRRGKLMETRNDHQVSTAVRFRELGMVSMAVDETELPACLDRLERQSVGPRIAGSASPELVATIRGFLRGGHR